MRTCACAGPLDNDAAAELVHATAEGGGMPADVLGFILKHSQGMPLQLEQMTRSLVASSLLFLNVRALQFVARMHVPPLCLAVHRPHR